MSDFAGLIFTFLPLFIVLLLANAAQRARRREPATIGLFAPASLAPEALTPGAPASGALAPGSFAMESVEPGGGEAASSLAPAPQRESSAPIFTALAYLSLGAMYVLAILGSLSLFALDALSRAQPQLLAGNPLANVELPNLLTWGLLLPGLIGIMLLLPPVRRFCARYIPIDAENPVHAVALSMTMLVIINMLLTIGVGLANLSTMLTQAQEAGTQITSFASIWGQQILMALLGFVGVGWLVRRNLREATQRLGIVWPSAREVLIGIGLAFAMVAVVIVIQAIAQVLGFGSDTDVEELTQQLLGPLFASPWGILTLGLAAALGEETLMRGAAQPRLGLLLTAGLFALLHSNYGITLSTGVVFMLGLVLGMVRMRYNTSTSMVMHATYNMVLGLMAYLSIDLLQQINK